MLIPQSNPDFPIIFMFSGQGSQSFHMGKDLYENVPEFKREMDQIDAMITASGRPSLLDKLYSPSVKPQQPFDDIRDSHPAIFMVEYALARALQANGIEPDYVLGASLGEVAAAAIAGAISLADALEMTWQQGQMLFQANIPGTLIAVLDEPQLQQTCPVLRQYSELAAINLHNNFLLAVTQQHLPKVEEALNARNVTFLKLPVKIPFHSSYIDTMQPATVQQLSQFPFKPLQTPLYSCATTQQVATFNAQHLWQVFRGVINLNQTVGQLEQTGNFRYIDVGPNGTFGNLIKYNQYFTSESEIYPILSPFGKDSENWQKLLFTLEG